MVFASTLVVTKCTNINYLLTKLKGRGTLPMNKMTCHFHILHNITNIITNRMYVVFISSLAPPHNKHKAIFFSS